MDNNNIELRTRRVFPWVLWNIWKARNRFVFEKVRLSVESVVKKAEDEAEEWFTANDSRDYYITHRSCLPGANPPWKPPPEGFVKCNIGASWLNLQENCGVSWLLREHKGNPLSHSRRAFSQIGSKLEADLCGLMWAVDSLWNLRHRKVIFESSSYQVVELFNSEAPPAVGKKLFDEIRQSLLKFDEWRIVFSPPHLNIPVTRIANSVTSEGRFQSYVARGASSWVLSSILAENGSVVGR